MIRPGGTAAIDAPTFEPRDLAEWSAWLEANHDRVPRVWLVLARRGGDGTGVRYEEAVEEALCWGWIDGLTHRLDERRFRQLFTPRRLTGTWSASNKERVARLAAAGRMRKAGLAAVEAARANGSWDALEAVDRLEEPADLAAALDAEPAARAAWDRFSASSRKGLLFWVQSAKRPATRAHRIAEIVRLAALGLRAQYPESAGR